MTTMNDTLKSMKSIMTQETASYTLEQLAEMYKTSLNPSILADCFDRLYRLVINTSSPYFTLTNEDIVSYSLETLDKCLQLYDPQKAGKFSTFFTVTFRNRLRTETQALSTDKRKAFINTDSYELSVEKGWDIATSMEQTSIDVMNSLVDYGLTAKEMNYCKYIMEGYSNKEIADMLQTTVMTLCNMRKNLRTKLPLTL